MSTVLTSHGKLGPRRRPWQAPEVSAVTLRSADKLSCSRADADSGNAMPRSATPLSIAADKDIGAEGQKAGYKAEKGGRDQENNRPERY